MGPGGAQAGSLAVRPGSEPGSGGVTGGEGRGWSEAPQQKERLLPAPDSCSSGPADFTPGFSSKMASLSTGRG